MSYYCQLSPHEPRNLREGWNCAVKAGPPASGANQ